MDSHLTQHYFYQQAGTKTYRYYAQLDSTSSLTTEQIWLKGIYAVGQIGNLMKSAYSSGSILPRSGPSDWSNYLEISITVPTNQIVVVESYLNLYSSIDLVYFDPLPEII